MPSDFRLVKTIGTPLDVPQGVVVDPKGFVNVLDGGFIKFFDQQGHYVRHIPWTTDSTNFFNSGVGLAMDPAGNYFVLTYSGVRKLSPKGQLLMSFSNSGPNPGQLTKPYSIAVDHAGNSYVTDNYKRLQKFDVQGKFEWAFTMSDSTGSSDEIACVAADPTGNIYLLTAGDSGFDQSVIPMTTSGQAGPPIVLQHGASTGAAYSRLLIDRAGNFNVTISNEGVYQYDWSGEYRYHFTSPDPKIALTFSDVSPSGMASDAAGNIYICLNGPNIIFGKLYKFSATGEAVGAWGNMGSYDCLIQDGAGNVLVFDVLKMQVVKLNENGQELARFGSEEPSPNQFRRRVVALAVDYHDNIYTLESDTYGTRLKKFNSQGRFLKNIENEVLNNSSAFSRPYAGLAVDHAGNIYVADITSDVVCKLDPAGSYCK